MPDYPFDGCRAKIDRAKHHLEELKARIKAGEDEQLYGINTYDDPKTGERVVEALLPRDLFVTYSVVAGEVVHQLRSALDHLIWELILRNGGVPKEGLTGFPVFRIEKPDYETKGLSRIKGVNDAAAAIVRRLQPFRPDYASDLLFLLHEMWNRDKHRLLNLTTHKIIGYQANYIYPHGRTKASRNNNFSL